jgi:putative Holliday junction resolvase
MGIDFGEKRIGIALSDPLNIFSYPFKTILNDQNLLTEIKKIITEKNVTKIVLGKPSGSNTSTISLINKLEKFKWELEKKFSVNVIFWNEDFTSSIARERILESVTKKNKRKDKSLVDRNSAAIILQEFLNDQ